MDSEQSGHWKGTTACYRLVNANVWDNIGGAVLPTVPLSLSVECNFTSFLALPPLAVLNHRARLFVLNR